MRRVAFLVDGFNLYHSLRAASAALGGAGTRWLDLTALCRNLLPLVGGGAVLERTVYFSALARHLEGIVPETIDRHERYLSCLRATGVDVRLSHFKPKGFRCPACSSRTVRHEEKETDVAMAAEMFELLVRGTCDAIAVVTGDSDLAPAFRTASRLFPLRPLVSIQPFHRASKELRQAATAHHSLSATQYVKHQLPDPFEWAPGRVMNKPPGW